MNSNQQPALNFAGQVCLTALTSFIVNGVIHPLGTVKNCIMTQTQVPRSIPGLYRGFWSIFGTDAAVFAIAYATNDELQTRMSPIVASVAAGVVSAPVVSIGESLMCNRQVNRISYLQSFKMAIRSEGIAMTILREVPYTTAIFFVAPWLQSRLRLRNDFENQAAAGGIAGAIIGCATTGVDRIKTIVQTHVTRVSIPNTIRTLNSLEGYRWYFKGGLARSLYIGLASSITNVVYNRFPFYFPRSLREE